MSSNPSTTTRAIAFRVPLEVYDIMERRIENHPRANSVGEYAKEQLIFHMTRKHGRSKCQ